jgi:hypothetical protein
MPFAYLASNSYRIVTPVTLGTVLGQKAYMLFYVKRTLAYGQSMAKLLAETNPTKGAKTVSGKMEATGAGSLVRSEKQTMGSG